ncbi:hypothetical protein FQB35_06540 [Crassaminicella thermophila]|uniref:DUF6398 domain-containing protein n=1 Tax=Crassaminicella thermophila TaxID=2599308 RepID=A0A5C0SE97_CRATE|nr:DUF6398 domain-containing protein [Crassaminicella thermophila]QEK12057.1 hypothetical protein FQB35_06540 [Crassaminicella thermophila]
MLIEKFCDENLNEEYKEMSLKLCEKLNKMNPSPLLKGRSKSLACGIVHAIGFVNFLFDSTTKML